MINLNTHKRFMRSAIRQARRGLGRVDPNPAVGCVIVKDNRIIAKGYYQRFGGPHAEEIALKRGGRQAEGATLYVTLEPCNYFGKTPPCVDAIIGSGIRKVVAAMVDPNPANSGKGFKRLRKNNIEVVSGILKKEAEGLNKTFIERMKRKRPYISVKIAQSLDGKTATRTGQSRWISSKASRAIAHRLRSRHDAVMVGVNTVLKDDPLLNVRTSYSTSRLLPRNPVKIIVDSRLRTPLNARILSKDSPARVVIATTKRGSVKREKMLITKGADILCIKDDSGRVDLKVLLNRLSRMGIGSILVEGGGELIASLLKDRLIDRLILFIAPILIGGRDAVTSLEGEGIDKIKDAFRLDEIKIRRIGVDIMIEGRV